MWKIIIKRTECAVIINWLTSLNERQSHWEWIKNIHTHAHTHTHSSPIGSLFNKGLHSWRMWEKL